MAKYYDEDNNLIEEAFEKELQKIHNKIEQGLNVEELKAIRKKLYYLKSRYEESGRRNLNIEAEIQCVNEFIHD